MQAIAHCGGSELKLTVIPVETPVEPVAAVAAEKRKVDEEPSRRMAVRRAHKKEERRAREDGEYVPVHLRRAGGGGKRHMVTFVEHRAVAAGAELRPSQRVECQWLVRNDSTQAWPEDVSLVCVDRHSAILADRVAVTERAGPGEEVVVKATITAPERPGEYNAFFRMASPETGRFGARLPVRIVVTSGPGGEAVAASKTLREKVDELAARFGLRPATVHRLRHRGVITSLDGEHTIAVLEEARALSATGLAPREVVATLVSRTADGPAATSSDAEDADEELLEEPSGSAGTPPRVKELKSLVREQRAALATAKQALKDSQKAQQVALKAVLKHQREVAATRGELRALASLGKAAHLRD
jgi:hypothetical protein